MEMEMVSVSPGQVGPKCDLCDEPAICIWSGDHSTRCFEHLTQEVKEILESGELSPECSAIRDYYYEGKTRGHGSRGGKS